MIIDGHSDILVDVGKHWMAGRKGRLANHHIPKMREGGVTGAWCPVAVDNPSHDGDPYDRMMRTLEAVHDEVDNHSAEVAIVTDSGSFVSTMASGRIALFMGIEGAMPLAGRPERVEELFNLGLRWFGLTWNARNEVGDGLGVGDPGGLTEVGREIVAEMERLGIVIDLTHSSIPLFNDVMDSTRSPIAVTHSNSRQLCDHVRNLTDEQLRLIMVRRGIVGINFFPALLTSANRRATLDDIVEHANYVGNSVGQEYVGLAADFIDYDQEAMAAGLAASTVDYGESTAYPLGAETTREMKNVLQVLEGAGWSESDVERIAWRNQIEFLRRVEEAGRTG